MKIYSFVSVPYGFLHSAAALSFDVQIVSYSTAICNKNAGKYNNRAGLLRAETAVAISGGGAGAG
jgi:hypothetical protein